MRTRWVYVLAAFGFAAACSSTPPAAPPRAGNIQQAADQHLCKYETVGSHIARWAPCLSESDWQAQQDQRAIEDLKRTIQTQPSSGRKHACRRLILPPRT